MSKSEAELGIEALTAYYILIHRKAGVKISIGRACAQPDFHPAPDQ